MKFKKIVSSILAALLLAFSVSTAFTASAAEVNEPITTEAVSEQEARATGLITNHSISISKSGTTLTITGRTKCTTEVVKCGFKEVVVQRRASSGSSWSDYYTYEDLYADSNSYTLSKSLTVSSSYQYRVVCTHYAKKNLFSTEKIDAASNIV